MTNTTTTTECAGYVVTNDVAIWGVGTTAEAAWTDFLAGMDAANITVLDDDEEVPEHGGDWTRESGFEICPATAALIAQVEAEGGDISWTTLPSGVCGTRDEA